MKDPDRFFVAGTDTGVGKTVASAVLLTGSSALYWKPVQCGTADPTDTEWLLRTTGLPESRFAEEGYRLREPLSPHAAAALDGVCIDLGQLSVPPGAETGPLIVEGAGGLLVPLNGRQMMVDLIRQLDLPVLLVARSGLGTINHTLLSLQVLRDRQIAVWGVLLNGMRNPGNRAAIEQFGRIRVVGELEPLPALDAGALRAAHDSMFGRKLEETPGLGRNN